MSFTVSIPDSACEPSPFFQEEPLRYALRSSVAKACNVLGCIPDLCPADVECNLVSGLQLLDMTFHDLPSDFQALRQVVQRLPLQSFFYRESVFSSVATIISADTVVVVGQSILGKPKDFSEALSMLRLLRGRSHVVFTACSVIGPAGIFCFALSSEVVMWSIPDEALLAYIATGESFDKAGGYAIQGIGAFLIQEIKGSWTNIVGLPVAELLQIMLSSGLIRLNDA